MITQTNVQRECVIIQRDNFGMKMNEITFKAKRSGLETFVDKSRDFICWLGDVLGPHSKTDGFQYSRK